eukprot:GGOE01041632.1.p1 GENE.GGOE01041632.1~~GGOE01041632.1.p1  ORF type:complete len:468 (+),score=85.59 GGOE01041632.1:101-1405(+)
MAPAHRQWCRVVPLLLFMVGFIGIHLWALHFRQIPQPKPLPSPSELSSATNHDAAQSRPSEALRYSGIPAVTHERMVRYGRWATQQLHQNLTGAGLVIGKWTGEKKGGYADRVKFVLNVFTVAIILERVFLIDWPELLDFFHCPYLDWQLQRWPVGIPATAVKVRIQDDFKGASFRSRNLSFVFPEPVIQFVAFNVPIQHKLLMNKLYAGWFEAFLGGSFPPHQLHGILQRIVFQPTATLRQAADTFLQTHLSGVQLRVGLQIRTKGLGRWKDPARLSAASNTCLMLCAQQVGRFTNHTFRVFLSTDNSAVKKAARDLLGDLVATNDAPPLHIDYASPAELQANLLSVLADSLLLSEHMDRLVLMHSGFGLLAGWRSLRPYILHPVTDPKELCLQNSADLTSWRSTDWCPLQYVTEYTPPWPPRFPYGWVPWKS